jgi:hypothetical protein
VRNKCPQLKVYLTIASFLLVFSSQAQNDSLNRFIGKWGICYSLDNLDTACKKPFNFFIFRNDNKYQGRDVILSDKKVPMLGTWTYLHDTIFIYSTYKGPYGEANMDNFIIKPVFLNKDMFYSIVYDTTENIGHYVYFTYRRLE